MLKGDPLSYPPRGMSHEEAARYVGVGESEFDKMVNEGVMPKPKRRGRRTIWDRVQLDIAFSAMPGSSSYDDDSSLDALLEKTRIR